MISADFKKYLSDFSSSGSDTDETSSYCSERDERLTPESPSDTSVGDRTRRVRRRLRRRLPNGAKVEHESRPRTRDEHDEARRKRAEKKAKRDQAFEALSLEEKIDDVRSKLTMIPAKYADKSGIYEDSPHIAKFDLPRPHPDLDTMMAALHIADEFELADYDSDYMCLLDEMEDLRGYTVADEVQSAFNDIESKFQLHVSKREERAKKLKRKGINKPYIMSEDPDLGAFHKGLRQLRRILENEYGRNGRLEKVKLKIQEREETKRRYWDRMEEVKRSGAHRTDKGVPVVIDVSDLYGQIERLMNLP